MHRQVKKYLGELKLQFPNYFQNVKVLDCGSLDINGNNRHLFNNIEYTGIDIVKGRNVDVVTKIHEFLVDKSGVYDVVISSEMLEHDKHFTQSLKAMFRLLRNGGLLIITAAGEGRSEHGTTNNIPVDSPLTNDYYRNVTISMLSKGLNFKMFSYKKITIREDIGDIYFVGIKK